MYIYVYSQRVFREWAEKRDDGGGEGGGGDGIESGWENMKAKRDREINGKIKNFQGKKNG